MFFDLLNDSERHTLLNLLVEVAHADGKMDDAEQETLRRYALSIGINDSDIQRALAEHHIEEGLQTLPGSSRRIMFLEATTLAMIDQDFADQEEEVLKSLAERLALGPSVAQRLIDHVAQGFKWNQAGLMLVQEDD